MDINPETVEKLAREYAKSLPADVSVASSETVEQLIILEEEQLELLNDFPRNSARINRAVGYLKNLTFRSLSKLSALSGNASYIPSVRTVACPAQNILGRLLNLQTDIFILSDKLQNPYSEKAEFLMLENRKAALLASL